MSLHLDERLRNADWPKRTPDMPDWAAFLKKLTPAQRKLLPAAYLPARAIIGAAFVEEQHPRDPGGDAGGEFIAKGTTGTDEGEDEKAGYSTKAGKVGYRNTGLAFQRTTKELLKPYRDGYGELVGGMDGDAIIKDTVANKLLETLEGDPKWDAMVAKLKEDDHWGRWEREVTEFKRNVAFQEWMDEHGSMEGWNQLNVPAPSANEIGVAMAVGSWAMSSSDNLRLSLSMQQAAIDEFGLRGISPTLNQTLLNADLDPVVLLGAQKFLRAQYDLTQQFFKDAGVTEVEAFRGMHFEDKVSPIPVGRRMAPVTFNPVSSFSTDYDTALNFATIGSTQEQPDGRPRTSLRAIVAQTIPVSHILSTPFTGFGCLNETEITVLGDTSEAYINAWQPSWYDAGGAVERDLVGEPPGNGDAFFLEWRDHKFVKVKKR